MNADRETKQVKTKRVFVLSQGGLGNQLFQALFCHNLAMSHPNYTVFYVNASSSNDRKFLLKNFFKDCSHVKQIVKVRPQFVLLIRGIQFLIRKNINIQKNIYWFPVRNAFSPISEVYENIEQQNHKNIFIKADFIANSSFDSCFTKALLNLIEKNSLPRDFYPDILIHLRRGDYMTNVNYGPLSYAFYLESIDLLSQNSECLVHTDDIKMPEKMEIGSRIFHRQVGKYETPFQLLRDAQHCSYFVGSNSTLSWWACRIRILKDFPIESMILPGLWFRNQHMINENLLNNIATLHQSIWES